MTLAASNTAHSVRREAIRLPTQRYRRAANRGVVVLSVALGSAAVLCGLNLDERLTGIDLREFVRAAYFSSLGLAAFGPAVFLSPWWAAERAGNRLDMLRLTVVPRPRLLWAVVRHTLTWPAFAWLTLAGSALFGFAHFPVAGRWFDCWGLPAFVLVAPLGILVSSTGVGCWVGTLAIPGHWSTVATAAFPALVWPSVTYVGFLVLPTAMVGDLKISIVAAVVAPIAGLVGWWAFQRAAARFDAADF